MSNTSILFKILKIQYKNWEELKTTELKTTYIMNDQLTFLFMWPCTQLA